VRWHTDSARPEREVFRHSGATMRQSASGNRARHASVYAALADRHGERV